MDTGINVMQAPAIQEEPKFERIEEARPIPEALNVSDTHNNSRYASTINKLQMLVNEYKNPNYKDLLIKNIYFFGYKLGKIEQRLPQKIFNQMDYEYNAKLSKDTITMNANVDKRPIIYQNLNRDYNYAVDLYNNLDAELNELQEVIGLLSN